MKRAILLLSVTSLFLAAAEPARADPFTIDQSYTATPYNVQYNLIGSNPIGQEFTPTLSSVHDVELALRNMGNFAETITVGIRIGDPSGDNLNGILLGTGSATVPALFDSVTGGLVHFDLAFSVGLIPGHLYAIQIADTGQFQQAVNVYGNTAAGYLGGDLITNNNFNGQADLIFAEGPNVVGAVPEPASITLAALGVVGLIGYGWRRRQVAA